MEAISSGEYGDVPPWCAQTASSPTFLTDCSTRMRRGYQGLWQQYRSPRVCQRKHHNCCWYPSGGLQWCVSDSRSHHWMSIRIARLFDRGRKVADKRATFHAIKRNHGRCLYLDFRGIFETRPSARIPLPVLTRLPASHTSCSTTTTAFDKSCRLRHAYLLPHLSWLIARLRLLVVQLRVYSWGWFRWVDLAAMPLCVKHFRARLGPYDRRLLFSRGWVAQCAIQPSIRRQLPLALPACLAL